MEVNASTQQVSYHECQLMTLLQSTTAKKMEDTHFTRKHCDRNCYKKQNDVQLKGKPRRIFLALLLVC